MSTGQVKKDEQRGTWYFRIDTRPVDGKRRQALRRGFPTRKAAQTALDELRKQMSTGRGLDPTTITFGRFLEDRWLPTLDASGLKPTTVQAYRNASKHLIRNVGGVPLVDLRGDDLEAVYASLADSSDSLRRQVHVVAHKSLKDAMRWRLVSYNAADDATPPPQPRPDPVAWSAEQVGRFLEVAAEDYWSALWMVAATTGMRRGELVGLKWSDIDLSTGTMTIERAVTVPGGRIHVDTPKSGRSRTISIDPGTVDALRTHRKRQAAELLMLGEYRPDTDWIWTWPDGSLVNPNVISRTFNRLVAAAELPPLSLHNLRHAWATNALRAGVDVKDVATRLGHASTRITHDIYTAPSTERDRQAATLIAGMYKPKQARS